METDSAQPDAAEPSERADEVQRLRRQLQRERARRLAAESMGERATAELYESVRELRAARDELVERAEEARLLGDLARLLRQDLDSQLLAKRAAESVVRLTDADRCEVLLVGLGDGPEDTVCGVSCRDADAPELPEPTIEQLTDVLAELLSAAAGRLRPVVVEDLEDSDLVTPEGARAIHKALGARSLGVVPVAAGGEVAGWIVLESRAPRSWEPRELTMCESLSHDVVTSLLQVRAFEQQRESVRRLEELDQAKDAFISTVSHELRTPLTSILGYLEMMTDGALGALDPSLSRGVEIIGRNVVRLRDLVEDLLTLSAYDAERVLLEKAPVDLAAVTADVLVDLQPMMRTAGISVEVTTEGQDLRVIGDLRQLERAVANVLSNAIKFSHPRGRVLVRLSGREDQVELEVADSGIGIPAREQPLLFQRFFRSSVAIAREIQGTGLGLPLVQTIVHSHGGKVLLDSTENVGTTVVVCLPRGG